MMTNTGKEITVGSHSLCINCKKLSIHKMTTRQPANVCVVVYHVISYVCVPCDIIICLCAMWYHMPC